MVRRKKKVSPIIQRGNIKIVGYEEINIGEVNINLSKMTPEQFGGFFTNFYDTVRAELAKHGENEEGEGIRLAAGELEARISTPEKRKAMRCSIDEAETRRYDAPEAKWMRDLRDYTVIAFLNMGRNDFVDGEFRASLNYFNCALELDERHPVTYNNKGLALAKLGVPSEAKMCYRKALELVPGFSRAQTNLDALVV